MRLVCKVHSARSLAWYGARLTHLCSASLRMRRSGIISESGLWNTFSIFSAIMWLLQLATILLFYSVQTEDSIWYEMQPIGDNNRDSYFAHYMVYFYAAVVYVMGKGEPTTALERVYATVFNVIGLFITAFLVGQVTHIIQKLNAKETKWRIKMGEVNDSMAQMGIDPDLQTRIRNYFAFSWAVNGGDDRGHAWLSDLSRTYHQQAKIQVNENLIASVPIFMEADKNFVHAVIMNLRQQLYLPGDYIIRCGDIGEEMYFVVRGIVQAMDQLESMVYTVLREGSFFGEIALLKKNSRRTATVRAFTYAQLNVLYKTDFETILQQFPEDAALLEAEAKLRERNSENVERIKQKRLHKRTNSRGRSDSINSESSPPPTSIVTTERTQMPPAPETRDDPSSAGKSPLVRALGASQRILRNGSKTDSFKRAVMKQRMAASAVNGFSKSANKLESTTIANLDADGEFESFCAKPKSNYSEDDLLATLKLLTKRLEFQAKSKDIREKATHLFLEIGAMASDLEKRRSSAEAEHESSTPMLQAVAVAGHGGTEAQAPQAAGASLEGQGGGLSVLTERTLMLDNTSEASRRTLTQSEDCAPSLPE